MTSRVSKARDPGRRPKNFDEVDSEIVRHAQPMEETAPQQNAAPSADGRSAAAPNFQHCQDHGGAVLLGQK